MTTTLTSLKGSKRVGALTGTTYLILLPIEQEGFEPSLLAGMDCVKSQLHTVIASHGPTMLACLPITLLLFTATASGPCRI